MITKKWLKIALAAVVFLGAASAGHFIEKFETDHFVVETVTDKAELDAADAGGSGIREDGRININTAPVEELVMLDGIGEKLAQRIIDYRSENGPFETVEELTLVSGISFKTLDVIRDKICTE